MAVAVKRDGETRKMFDSGNQAADENAAFSWLLGAQGQSVEWAIRYEGWAIVECPSSADPRVSVIYRGTERGRAAYDLLLSESPDQKLGPLTYDQAVSEVRERAHISESGARELVGGVIRNRMVTAKSVTPDFTREAVRHWLLGYAWAEDTPEEKAAAVDCIMAQGKWQHIDALADKFAGAQEEPGLEAFNQGCGFALSALYECHGGPHLETCPDRRPAD